MKHWISLWFPLGRTRIQPHQSWTRPPVRAAGQVLCWPTTASPRSCWSSRWPSACSTPWGKAPRRQALTTFSPVAGPWRPCPSGSLSAPVLCQLSRFWVFPLRFIITAPSSSTCASGRASTPCWRRSSSCQFSFAWESPAATRSSRFINVDTQPKHRSYNLKVLVVFGLGNGREIVWVLSEWGVGVGIWPNIPVERTCGWMKGVNRGGEDWRGMCAPIFCCVVTEALHLSQYLKMRFGRGMQLLGSIQFLVVTVRGSDVPRWHNNATCAKHAGKWNIWYLCDSACSVAFYYRFCCF